MSSSREPSGIQALAAELVICPPAGVLISAARRLARLSQANGGLPVLYIIRPARSISFYVYQKSLPVVVAENFR